MAWGSADRAAAHIGSSGCSNRQEYTRDAGIWVDPCASADRESVDTTHTAAMAATATTAPAIAAFRLLGMSIRPVPPHGRPTQPCEQASGPATRLLPGPERLDHRREPGDRLGAGQVGEADDGLLHAGLGQLAVAADVVVEAEVRPRGRQVRDRHR